MHEQCPGLNPLSFLARFHIVHSQRLLSRSYGNQERKMDDVIDQLEQVERPREDAPLSTQTCPYLDNKLTKSRYPCSLDKEMSTRFIKGIAGSTCSG